MYDIREVRRDFPILDRRVGEMKLIYLDNAATSQKPRQVLDILNDYYEVHNANIHRGVHRLAEEATALYEGSRQRVARFLGGCGVVEVDELHFTHPTIQDGKVSAHSPCVIHFSIPPAISNGPRLRAPYRPSERVLENSRVASNRVQQ